MRGRLASGGVQAGLWASCWALAVAGGCQGNDKAAGPTPPSVADSQTQIFVADWANHRLARFAGLGGESWTTCGESGAVEIRYPVGVCLDAGGRILVSEQQARLHRLDDISGAGWTSYDLEPEAQRLPNKYLGCWVCVDRSGRIYASDGARDRIVRIDDISGAGRVTLGAGGSGERQFRHPAGVWVDEQDRLYVADFDNFR